MKVCGCFVQVSIFSSCCFQIELSEEQGTELINVTGFLSVELAMEEGHSCDAEVGGDRDDILSLRLTAEALESLTFDECESTIEWKLSLSEESSSMGIITLSPSSDPYFIDSTSSRTDRISFVELLLGLFNSRVINSCFISSVSYIGVLIL